MKEVSSAVGLTGGEPSDQARFGETGPLSQVPCEQLGMVGAVARACGLQRGVRHEFPSGLFRFSQVPLSTWHTGDVFARAYVRWLEIQRSAAFVREQLTVLPDGPTRAALEPARADGLVVGL